MRVIRSKPEPAAIKPGTINARGPNLGSSCEATPAKTIIPAVNGRKAKPDFNGLYPKTTCRYKPRNKNIENKPAPTTNEPMYEPPRFRSVITRSGISGLATFDSIITKITSRSRAAIKNEIVVELDQPLVAASLKP